MCTIKKDVLETAFMDENIHLETTDFLGRRIVCTELQWKDHIVGCKHHDYMEGEEKTVIEALTDPDYGLRHIDADDPTKRCYYKSSPRKDYFTKVVVKFENENGEGLGYIVTAFMPDNIRPGEKPELKR